eukprot:295736_1
MAIYTTVLEDTRAYCTSLLRMLVISLHDVDEYVLKEKDVRWWLPVGHCYGQTIAEMLVHYSATVAGDEKQFLDGVSCQTCLAKRRISRAVRKFDLPKYFVVHIQQFKFIVTIVPAFMDLEAPQNVEIQRVINDEAEVLKSHGGSPERADVASRECCGFNLVAMSMYSGG